MELFLTYCLESDILLPATFVDLNVIVYPNKLIVPFDTTEKNI